MSHKAKFFSIRVSTSREMALKTRIITNKSKAESINAASYIGIDIISP